MSKTSDYQAIRYFVNCNMNFQVIHLLTNNGCTMFLNREKINNNNTNIDALALQNQACHVSNRTIGQPTFPDTYS